MSDTTFRIHPAMGISRVGNSDEYYLAPESSAGLDAPDAEKGDITGGLPIKPGTRSTPISDTDLRDADGALKRQAQRFRIYSYETDKLGTYPYKGESREITIGSTVNGQTVADIFWTVHMANKMANAWNVPETIPKGDFSGLSQYENNNYPPLRNAGFTNNNDPSDPDRLTNLVIDAGPRAINGARATRINFDKATPPTYFKKGTGIAPLPNYPTSFPSDNFTNLTSPSNVQVRQLGALETDDKGRLIVLGGQGTATGWSQSENQDGSTIDLPFPLNDDVNNDGWFDDTSDGPVTAVLLLSDGSYVEIENIAWAVSTDPSYAPQIRNVNNVWDEVFDTWVHNFGLVPSLYQGPSNTKNADNFVSTYQPSFWDDVYPMFRAAHLNQFSTGFNSVAIGAHERLNRLTPDSDPPSFLDVDSLIRSPYPDDNQLNIGAPRMPLALGDTGAGFLAVTRSQYFFLKQWSKSRATAARTKLSPGQQLDKDVLSNLLGGRFSPGIDVTFIVRDIALYNPNWNTDPNVGPFRMNAAPLDYSKATKDKPFLGVGYTPARDGAHVEPGDICKFMALPWHTDYNSCATHLPAPNPGGDVNFSTQTALGRNITLFWSWPAQRPVSVYTYDDVKDHDGKLDAPQRYSVRGEGTQGVGGPNNDETLYPAQQVGRFQDRTDMVKQWQKIGTVIQAAAIKGRDENVDPDYYLEVESHMSDVSDQVVPWPNLITDEVDPIEW